MLNVSPLLNVPLPGTICCFAEVSCIEDDMRVEHLALGIEIADEGDCMEACCSYGVFMFRAVSGSKPCSEMQVLRC